MSKVEEKLYGQTMSNAEKHRMIMDLIVSKKKMKFRKTKREEFLQKKIIEKKKKKCLVENKRKMLEVKWRNKISYIAMENYKSKIESQHWRIGDSIKHLKKKSKSKKKVLRNRIYTPETEERLKKKLEPFKKTNQFGLTPLQVKKVEKKFNDKKAETKIFKSKTEDGHTHIIKKTVLKKYKLKPNEEEGEGEEEMEGEGEGEEEEAEIEENENEKIEEEEVEEDEKGKVKNEEKEKRVEEVKKKMKKENLRYEPLYPSYQENEGVDDVELPENDEENKHKEEAKEEEEVEKEDENNQPVNQ